MSDDLVKRARYYGSHGQGIKLAVSEPEPSPELMDNLADRIEELEAALAEAEQKRDFATAEAIRLAEHLGRLFARGVIDPHKVLRMRTGGGTPEEQAPVNCIETAEPTDQ